MTEPKSKESKEVTVPPYTRKDGTKVNGYTYTRNSGILAGSRPVIEAGEDLIRELLKPADVRNPTDLLRYLNGDAIKKYGLSTPEREMLLKYGFKKFGNTWVRPSFDDLSNGQALRKLNGMKIKPTNLRSEDLQALAVKGIKYSDKVGKFARVATTATKAATKVLPAVGAGLDFATGLAEGEDVQRAATGAAGSTLGSIVGGIGMGAAAGSIFPGIGTFAGAVVGLGGAVIGGLAGGYAADRVDEAVRGKK
ncbi:hypothetical protein Syn7502_01473 [Synechococcus sp. PCC 7502]|uniref:hypothetical protein n=1 Tax=Synechococcus sp. PCC 7502 TaxID=1173263 RepID=UPI00029FFEB7|nr:hypothetical protein [Synechococcus sp. PCC 7502]AFY73541.1 hypothetical protein Syn7502_01473 [Synechococcus sp. PCC 7502]